MVENRRMSKELNLIKVTHRLYYISPPPEEKPVNETSKGHWTDGPEAQSSKARYVSSSSISKSKQQEEKKN